MHLFLAIDCGGNKKLLDAMLQTGFQVLKPEEFNGEDRFFCAVSNGLCANILIKEKWRPRLIFTKTTEGIFHKKLYTWQQFTIGAENIFLGTLYERAFVLPDDWHLSYGAGFDDEQLFYKAITDYTYRYLLEELMEETAQWCGHMSSVVHKF